MSSSNILMDLNKNNAISNDLHSDLSISVSMHKHLYSPTKASVSNESNPLG